MIFLTVGTHPQPFDRLVRGVDQAVQQGDIRKPVFGQIGQSRYMPRHYEWTRFMEYGECEAAIKRCSLLICHGGAGSIINGLAHNKNIISVPRRKSLGEHVDDQQFDLTTKLGSEGRIIVIDDMQFLSRAVLDAEHLSHCADGDRQKGIVNAVSTFLEGLATYSSH